LVASASDWPLDASERFLVIDFVAPPEYLSPEVQADLDALSRLRNYALPTGILLAVAATGGIALAFHRQRQSNLRIVRMYPNPVSNLLHLEMEGEPTLATFLSTSAWLFRSKMEQIPSTSRGFRQGLLLCRFGMVKAMRMRQGFWWSGEGENPSSAWFGRWIRSR
jgi:hypothetical protein